MEQMCAIPSDVERRASAKERDEKYVIQIVVNCVSGRQYSGSAHHICFSLAFPALLFTARKEKSEWNDSDRSGEHKLQQWPN